MRIQNKKEHASFAAPWSCSAMPAVIPSTMPSVGMGRAALHLSRASGQLLVYLLGSFGNLRVSSGLFW